jgi:hypothetical protein
VVLDGYLYVLNQSDRTMLKFDANSGNFMGKILEYLPDDPECIILSPC